MSDPIETIAAEPIDPRAENAIRDGLFTRRDFVRPDEIPEYDEFRTGLLGCLNPQTPLEGNLADEIVSSQWRLRRCRLIEGVLATRAGEDLLLSPEDDERQKSVDRARAQAQNALRKAAGELRKVQTERECRIVYTFGKGWGLAESSRAFAAFHQWDQYKEGARAKDFQKYKEMLEQELGPLPPAVDDDDDDSATAPDASGSDTFAPGLSGKVGPCPASPGLFCKNAPVTVQKVGRNEPCPCGSGAKYKKCCIDRPRPQSQQAA